MPPRLTGVIGMCVILGLAWLVSRGRWQVSGRLVFWGLALQAFFGLLVLKMHPDAIFAASRPSPVS